MIGCGALSAGVITNAGESKITVQFFLNNPVVGFACDFSSGVYFVIVKLTVKNIRVILKIIGSKEHFFIIEHNMM